MKPYGMLAYRTIGTVKEVEGEDSVYVGLEGSFNEYLRGVDGEMLMKKIEGNLWKPVQSEISQEPIPGKDVYTSIDVDLQDVAETALMKQLKNQDALNGCVVLMKV